MPKLGEFVDVVCRVPPVQNRKEGVSLWNEGDRAQVVWSHFWEGMVARGALHRLPTAEELMAAKVAEEAARLAEETARREAERVRAVAAAARVGLDTGGQDDGGGEAGADHSGDGVEQLSEAEEAAVEWKARGRVGGRAGAGGEG